MKCRYGFLPLLASTCLALGWSSTSSAAPILIDDFSTPTVSAAGVATGLPLTTPLGGGITRTITASGTFTNASTYQINVPPNTFTLNTATGQTITLTIEYTFSTPLNISANSTLEFNVLSYDLGPFGIKLDMFSGVSNLYTQTISLPNPSPSPGSAFVSFGPFGPLSNVDKITLTFNTGPISDLDFRIGGDGGGIKLNDEIPEPGTLATLGLIGVVGGLALRRRLRQKTT
jgi:hypothetical protein